MSVAEYSVYGEIVAGSKILVGSRIPCSARPGAVQNQRARPGPQERYRDRSVPLADIAGWLVLWTAGIHVVQRSQKQQFTLRLP